MEPLFINTSRDFPSIIKFNAQSGRMYRVDRTNTGAGWESNEVDVSDKFSAVFDLESIQVGWAYFSPTGPQWVLSVFGKEPRPPQPQDRGESMLDSDGKVIPGKLLFKQAFKVRILLSKACGGDVREFGGNSLAIVGSIGELFEKYAGSPERAQEKLPAVKLAGITKVGTNYRPNWEIVSWVDRPEKLREVFAENHDAKLKEGYGPDDEVAAIASGLVKTSPPETGRKTVSAPAPWDEEDELPPPMKKKGVASQFKAAVEADADGDFG